MPFTIRPAAEDVRRTGDEWRLAWAIIGLLGESPLAPVDPAVGAEIGAVQVIGATRERFTLKPLDPLIGHAIAVGIGQLPDAGGRRNVERSVVPHGSLGEHHLVGEDRPRFIAAVAVTILEPDDPVRPLGKLLLDVIVRARGIADVKPALLVESGGDGPIDQGWASHQLDRETCRYPERALSQLEFGAVARCRGHSNPEREECREEGQGALAWKGRCAHRNASINKGDDRRLRDVISRRRSKLRYRW